MLFIIYDELSIVISKISFFLSFFEKISFIFDCHVVEIFFQLTVDCKYKIYTLTVILNTKLTTGQLF